MLLKYFFLIILGLSSGALVSSGVVTVLIAVGLVPRFAGRTNTAKHIWIYENCVIFGTILGTIVSIFSEFYPFCHKIFALSPLLFCSIFGFFIGCFVGCLALSIAEMLDAIPIYTRRLKFKYGIGIVILSMAIGKLVGSVLYFMKGMG